MAIRIEAYTTLKVKLKRTLLRQQANVKSTSNRKSVYCVYRNMFQNVLGWSGVKCNSAFWSLNVTSIIFFTKLRGWDRTIDPMSSSCLTKKKDMSHTLGHIQSQELRYMQIFGGRYTLAQSCKPFYDSCLFGNLHCTLTNKRFIELE